MGTILNQPIFFERNRVWRVYKGGLQFHNFFGDEEKDGFYPEEWVASVVRAINRDSTDQREGLSILENTDISLKNVIEKYPREMLGNRKDFGVLVKLLDSAIRLPVQAHPDKTFSKKHFCSDFGKTEMWLVIGTRKNASIYLGFKEKVSKEEFEEAVRDSYYDKDRMKQLLNEIPVKPGDVYLIPAKTIHAIGAGCLILEVQEPTDFTIQPEYWCDDYLLTEEEMYIGLTKSTAMECFDFQSYGNEVVLSSKREPKVIFSDDTYKKETIITKNDTTCFSVNRYKIVKKMEMQTAPAIYIITEGEGTIEGKEYKRKIKKGDYFFLPYYVKGKYEIKTDLLIEMVECLPPEE